MAPTFEFFQAINGLAKITNGRVLSKKFREIREFVLSKHNAFYPYRLALELDRRGRSIAEMEDCVIKLSRHDAYNQRYLVMLALDTERANKPKLEQAVIDTKNATLIAEFACFVPGSDEDRLENIVLGLRVAKASYLFVKYRPECQLEEHKKVLLKSRKSKYLYLCAKNTVRKEELSLIEDLICRNKSLYFVRILGTVPGVDLVKLENRIISSGNFEEIRKMYQLTKSPRLAKYIILL